MRSRKMFLPALIVLIVAAVLWTERPGGNSAVRPQDGDTAAVTLGEREIVRIERQEISSILSLDGRVENAVRKQRYTVVVPCPPSDGPTAPASASASPSPATSPVPTSAKPCTETRTRRFPFLRIVAPVKPEEVAYTMAKRRPQGIRAKIIGGPDGFGCGFTGLRENTAGTGESDAGTVLHCRVPADVLAVAGMKAYVVVTLAESSVRWTLPRSAVFGDQQRGYVLVRRSGLLERRDVRLGRSDTERVEIRAGLSPEEDVLARPTQMDLDGVSS